MIYIVVLFYLILFVFLKFRILDSISHKVLICYLSIWFVALILSLCSPYGLTKAHDSTIFLLLSHLAMFTLGYVIPKNNKVKTVNVYNYDFQNSVDKIINNKLFLGLFAIVFIYIISLFISFSQAIVVANTVSDVRKDFYAGELYGEGYKMINAYLLMPFHMLILPLFCYMILYKRNLKCILFGVEYILYSSLSGARGGLFDIIIGVFFVFYCTRYQYLKQKMSGTYKRVIWLSLITVALFSIISWMTAIRKDNSNFSRNNFEAGVEMTMESVVKYLGGPVVAFDYAINSDYVNQVGGYQYGQMTFASVEELIFNIRVAINKVIPIGLYERPMNKIGSMIQDYISLGNSIEWNALYTSCMYYYLDFGIIGVILLPFFLGLWVRKIMLMFYQYKTFYIYLICSFLFVIMIDSVTRIFFSRLSQLLFVFVVYVLAKRDRTFTNKLIRLKNMSTNSKENECFK